MIQHFQHVGLDAACNWSKLLADHHSRYWQVELNQGQSRNFLTILQEIWQFGVLPFGLSTIHTIFDRLIGTNVLLPVTDFKGALHYL